MGGNAPGLESHGGGVKAPSFFRSLDFSPLLEGNASNKYQHVLIINGS
jgi:hypothetical protein